MHQVSAALCVVQVASGGIFNRVASGTHLVERLLMTCAACALFTDVSLIMNIEPTAFSRLLTP